jgi:hypothetical protein
LARQLPEGEEGNIVNLLDQRVWKLTPYFISYTIAKMGLVDSAPAAWRWPMRRASGSTASGRADLALAAPDR